MDPRLTRQRCPEGTVIFREGERGDRAFLIEQGRVEVSTEEHGRRVVLGALGPGSLLGEMAVLDDAPRTATATAAEESLLAVITREQITERLKHADPVLRMLMQIIMHRYRTGLGRIKGELMTGEYRLVQPGSDTQSLAIDKFRLENDLRAAIENGQLDVFYQPLLDVAHRAWAGFEALTRWNHPERGPIRPDQFIALAEETDLIVPIGLFVLERACAQLKQLQAVRDARRPGLPPLIVGVNVSARQIEEPGFIDRIAGVVARADLPPQCLKLEITESLVVDYQSVAGWVRAAKAHGFTVALDDFGAGYSSFGHLLELEFDTLKIDQTFIRAMSGSHKGLELVRGIVALGHGLELNIVAEGVETDAQLQILDALGVKYGQGYFIGKPMNLEDALARLTAGA